MIVFCDVSDMSSQYVLSDFQRKYNEFLMKTLIMCPANMYLANSFYEICELPSQPVLSENSKPFFTMCPASLYLAILCACVYSGMKAYFLIQITFFINNEKIINLHM